MSFLLKQSRGPRRGVSMLNGTMKLILSIYREGVFEVCNLYARDRGQLWQVGCFVGDIYITEVAYQGQRMYNVQCDSINVLVHEIIREGGSKTEPSPLLGLFYTGHREDVCLQ